MKKRYLIMVYEGPLDGWRSVTYSDVVSTTVYDDEGTEKLEDAEKIFELVSNSIGEQPAILVHVVKGNGIEPEYI